MEKKIEFFCAIITLRIRFKGYILPARQSFVPMAEQKNDMAPTPAEKDARVRALLDALRVRLGVLPGDKAEGKKLGYWLNQAFNPGNPKRKALIALVQEMLDTNWGLDDREFTDADVEAFVMRTARLAGRDFKK